MRSLPARPCPAVFASRAALGLAAASLAGLAAGCSPAPAVGLGLADVASVATFHRGLFDLAYSGVTGRDCSIVRLDRGESYCKPQEAPPARPPYCTRSLGVVDCWADPQGVPNLSQEVADGPRTLTPAQERQRTARWPNL